MEHIDWEEMRTGFNRMYGTEYPDIRSFVKSECQTLGIQEFAEKLGVSGPSVDRIKRKLNLNTNHLKWKNKRAKVMELAKAGKTRNMSAIEIAKHVGYLALNTVYNMSKEEGFEFKRRMKKAA